MNRTDFINIMADSKPIDRQMLGEVYELIDIFPYFQTAHLVLLKALQSNNDVKFENQLRSSAIHIADREALYYLLKERPISVALQERSAEGYLITEASSSDTQQTVIESAKNSDDLITEIERGESDPVTQDHASTDAEVHGHSIMVNNEQDYSDTTGIMLVIDEVVSPDEEKVFYMDPGFSVPDFTDLLELEVDLPQENEAEERNGAGAIENITDSSDKMLQSELIDRFIVANPRIEPVREKTDLPHEHTTKYSDEEDGGFITETLARIYTNQGYYSKAIDIYEKLSLKFPEKSSYFASQIEKVKEHIKK